MNDGRIEQNVGNSDYTKAFYIDSASLYVVVVAVVDLCLYVTAFLYVSCCITLRTKHVSHLNTVLTFLLANVKSSSLIFIYCSMIIVR